MTTEDERRAAYLAILDFPSAAAAIAHGSALTRAHDLRKFEIGHYWTRSAYFWGFQLVAFAALALTVKDGRIAPPLVLAVAVVGAITAFAAILTAYGSKFWQENWERHVDMLEAGIEGRLAQTVLVTDELSFSVSRVNERLLELVLLGWLLAFTIAAAVLICPSLLTLGSGAAAAWQIGSTAIALAFGLWWVLRGRGLAKLISGKHAQRSKLADRAYRFETMDKMPAA